MRKGGKENKGENSPLFVFATTGAQTEQTWKAIFIEARKAAWTAILAFLATTATIEQQQQQE